MRLPGVAERFNKHLARQHTLTLPNEGKAVKNSLSGEVRGFDSLGARHHLQFQGLQPFLISRQYPPINFLKSKSQSVAQEIHL